jgi:hypothetical protein
MLGPIGASNPFLSGVLFDPSSGPELKASGGLKDPTWFIDLPDTFPASDLSSESRPSEPGLLTGVSDGTVLLYSPLNPSDESLLGVYRLANGELVWSTNLPRDVYPVSDQKHLYLVDRRSPTLTTIAVIAPSRAQILNCFAATGTPLPAPSPIARTATAFDGTLYVSFSPDGTSTTIQGLSELGAVTVATQEPNPLALHGVLSRDGRKVLLASSGSQATFSLYGYDLATPSGSKPVTVDAAAVRSAPRAVSGAPSPDPDVDSVIVMDKNTTPFEARNFIFSGDKGVMVFGTSSQSLLLVALDIDVKVLWSLPIAAPAETGLSVSADTVHLSSSSNSPQGAPRAAIILDIESGKFLGKVRDVRWPAGVGTGPLMHSVWAGESGRVVQVFNGSELFATIGSDGTLVEPLASSSTALVVYAEVSGRRVVATYVLDPSAAEVPIS